MKLGFVLHSPGATWAGETLALEMNAGWSGRPAALGNHWVTGRPLNRHAALQPFIAANRRNSVHRASFSRGLRTDLEADRQTARARRFSSGSSKARCPEPARVKPLRAAFGPMPPGWLEPLRWSICGSNRFAEEPKQRAGFAQTWGE